MIDNDKVTLLIYSAFTKSFCIRQYNKDSTFQDYKIMSDDLEIKIIDESAYLVEDGENSYIDTEF